MTREDKIKAFEMKLDGATYQEIAVCFGVSKQCIQQLLIGGKRRNTWTIAQKGIVYKNLVEYMLKNEIHTIKDFGIHIGLKIQSSYLLKKLKGISKFNIYEIQQILSVTGMSYEEAFRMQKEEERCREQ